MESVDKEGGCILCEKIAQDNDEENLIVFRGDHNFIIMNIYPYNTGHLMVAPYRHVSSLEDLTTEETAEMMELAKRSMVAIRDEMAPDGFNLGINISRVAGAGVADHVHMHVVPRWAGDTNFMPVLGSTRVLPELPGDTYRKLRRDF